MNSLAIALFVSGVLTWVRIEFGVGVLLGIGFYLLLFHYKDVFTNKIFLTVFFFIGTIPMWINNYIATGSPLKHPFLLANEGLNYLGVDNEIEGALIGYGMTNPLGSLFHLFVSPGSGAIGLFIIIPLIAIVIPAYLLKRVKISKTEWLLLIMAFSSSSFYIVTASLYMGADPGIMPDMRYFIFLYTIVTLFMLSIISKIFPDLKYKKMIIYYILSVGLFLILFIAYASTISSNGTYRDLARIINTATTLLMGIGLIAVINDIRLNKNYVNYIIPVLIAIPMAWQLVMVFIYHTSKAQAYPMFLPITEFLFNYVFGLIT